MREFSDIRRGAEILVKESLGMRKGEDVVIFCDYDRLEIANECSRIILKNKGSATIFFVSDSMRPMTKTTFIMRKAMEEAEIGIIMLEHRSEETTFRREIIGYSRTRPCRVANMPGITKDHVAKYLDFNYARVKKDAENVGAELMKAKEIEVTTKEGTAIKVPLRGWQKPFAEAETGRLIDLGTWGNLPAGEAFTIPEINSADGVIVANGSFPGCKIEKPLQINVAAGKIVGMTPENSREHSALEELLKKGGKNSKVLIEVGIGMNPTITSLSGDVVADEKAKETMHFAFGSNISFGGKVEAKGHTDIVILKPTIKLDGVEMLKEGRLSKDFVFEENYTEIPPLQASPSEKIARNEGARCLDMGLELYRYWKGCLGFTHLLRVGNIETSRLARKVWFNVGVFKPYSRTVRELERILHLADSEVLGVLAVMARYGLIASV